MKIRDRIKDFRRVKASTLRPSPHNWRVHNESQRDALRGVLAEIGYAEALVCRELEGGGLELIDGHMRAAETPDEMVPVLVLDVTEDEAATLIATLDPIGAMADVNSDALRGLLANREPEDANLKNLLTQLSASLGSGDGGRDRDEKGGESVDGMDLRPHEHYDFVIMLARTTHEWNQLCELLGLELVQRGRGSFKRMGVGRGIEASKLIEMLDHGNVPNRGAKPAQKPKPKKGSRSSA